MTCDRGPVGERLRKKEAHSNCKKYSIFVSCFWDTAIRTELRDVTHLSAWTPPGHLLCPCKKKKYCSLASTLFNQMKSVTNRVREEDQEQGNEKGVSYPGPVTFCTAFRTLPGIPRFFSTSA